jgi:hypothetical protein
MPTYAADADICWVLLQGVHGKNEVGENPDWRLEFRDCKWFKRGWTLQELLAPKSVYFFSQDAKELGNRATLSQEISKRTTIPEKVILKPSTRNKFSVATRKKWSQGRRTRLVEDGAYCLMGLFGVSFPPSYGEKKDKAFARLDNEIAIAQKRIYEAKWTTFVFKLVQQMFWILTGLAAIFGILPLEMQSTYRPGLDVSLSISSPVYPDLNASWPIFAIFGKTGVGKSSFIEALGGRNLTTGLGPVVCEGLESCGSCLNSFTHHIANTRLGTDDYSFYAAQLDFGDVYVVDTPGFDDSKGRSDEDTLISIWNELDRLYKGNTRLKGIIYLYDISAQRIGGMSTRVSLRML